MISRLPVDFVWPDGEDVVVTFEFFREMVIPYTDGSGPQVGDVIRIGRYVAEVSKVDPLITDTYTLRRLHWAPFRAEDGTWVDDAPH